MSNNKSVKKIAIDFGNFSTKMALENEGVIELLNFESRFEEEGAISGGTCNKVSINGSDKTFKIGKGLFDPEPNKINKKYFVEMLASAIGLSTDEREVELCIGLPVNYYDKNKDKLIEKIRENRYLEFSLSKDGNPPVNRVVIIKKVKVVPEAVGAFVELVERIQEDSQDDANFLIIDIGGITIDSCIIEEDGSVKKPITDELGMIDFYNNINNEIKSTDSRYRGGVTGIDKIVKDNFVIKYSNGESTDVSYLKKMLESRAIEIFEYIRRNYIDYDNYKVVLCGGGAKILKEQLNELFFGAYFSEDRFDNVKGFLKLLVDGAGENNKPTVLVKDDEVESLIKTKGKVVGANA